MLRENRGQQQQQKVRNLFIVMAAAPRGFIGTVSGSQNRKLFCDGQGKFDCMGGEGN